MSSKILKLLRNWDQAVQKYESRADEIQKKLSEMIHKDYLNSDATSKIDLRELMDETGKCSVDILTETSNLPL